MFAVGEKKKKKNEERDLYVCETQDFEGVT